MLKKIGLGILVLSFVFVMGAGSANADLTLGALTVASSAALTLTGAVGSAVNLGTTATTGAINIGTALTSGALTVGKSDMTSAVTLYGGTTTGANSLFDNTTTSNTTALAALTSGSVTIGNATATGAFTIRGAQTTGANKLFNVATTSNIAIGEALTTGSLTLGAATQTTGVTTVYGGSLTNAIRLLPQVGAVATEAHAVDVVSGGELSSGDNLVGVNVVLTPTGTAGTWASAVYGKTVQGATKTVDGYISGGEFEVADTNAAPSEVHTLVLDGNSTVYDTHSSFIWAQDFGAADMPNLIKISGTTIGSGAMVQTSADTDLVSTHSLKIEINGTAYYIPISTSQAFD